MSTDHGVAVALNIDVKTAFIYLFIVWKSKTMASFCAVNFPWG